MASARWSRRNARARSLGYQNYYDYRIHNYGKIPASKPAPTGQIRKKLRGHASAEDLIRAIPNARSVIITAFGRDERGRYSHFEGVVHGRDNETRFYTLRGEAASNETLKRIKKLLEEGDVPFELMDSP